MSNRALIIFGVTAGSIVGDYVPTLWGASALSFSSLISGTVGAVAGWWLVLRLMD